MNQILQNVLDKSNRLRFCLKYYRESLQRFSVLVVLTILTASLAFSQTQVSGTVKDPEGLPLIGVSVKVKGTSQGVATDLNGGFTIAVPNQNSVLEFTYISYLSQEVTVGNNRTLSVVLQPDVQALSEVVVVGYGTQKRAEVTGSISSIKGDELAQVPAPNITESMAGRISGISMRPNGGQPGFDSPDIHIRGVVTTGDNKPLVIVDGIKRDNMQQIDPSTIETVTILKDAAAVAPFGIGGANGVVLITTKRGLVGKPQVRLSSSIGFSNPTYLPDMLDARDYMILQNEGYYNQSPNGTTPPNDPDLIANYDQLHKDDPYKYPNSNFTELFNKNTPTQNYSLDFRGGTENVTYYASVGYYDQKGIFDPVGYNRYNYNVNLEMKPTATTKVGFSLQGSISRIDDIDADETTGNHLFRAFYKFLPTQTLIYPGGERWGESSANSPVGVLKSPGYRKVDQNTLLSTLFVEQQIIDGLSVKGVFSYDPTQINNKLYHVPFKYHVIDLSTNPYSFTEAVSLQEGGGKPYTWLSLENRRQTNYTYQGYVNYSKTFNDVHSVTGLLVAEGRQYKGDFFNARRDNFSVGIDELGLGSSNRLDFNNDGNSNTGSEVGYVYRLAYAYDQKYIFEAAGRYDGHYYFAPGSRWGYFPSFSAAWRISEEKFMDGTDNWLTDMKIRGSWGKAGMLAGSAFQYMTGYNLRGNAYAFGNGTLIQGSRVEREPNPNITWEISTKTNVGVDFNLWNSRLNVEFDYFTERRTGMLLAPQVTLPVEYGLDLSQENKGEMKNRGFELSAGTRGSFSEDFSYSLNANVSYAKNSMIEVFQSDAEANNPNRTRVGQPFGTPYGFKSLGMFSTSDDTNGDGIVNAQDGYNVQQFGDLHPGDIRYADLSGPNGTPDGVIDDNDLTVIGNPVYPAWTFGFTPSVEWKGVGLSLFFQGSGKSNINIRQFMTVPFENNGSNTAYEYYDNRWTPENQNAKYPRSLPAPYSNNTKASDFWMANTSYLRLKTASISYRIPERLTKQWGIGSLRVYATGQNMFTFSKLKHIDPEVGYSNRETSYPVMKSTTFGIELNF